MDLAKVLAQVFSEGSLTPNEKEVLYHVLANSNALFQCPLRSEDLRRMTSMQNTAFYAARKRLLKNHYLVEHQNPHYYVAWPYTLLYNQEGGGGRLWTTPQKVRLLHSLVAEKITALTSITEDQGDRQKAAQQGHGIFTKAQEYAQNLHTLDLLHDIEDDLDAYLKRNETATVPLSADRPKRSKSKSS